MLLQPRCLSAGRAQGTHGSVTALTAVTAIHKPFLDHDISHFLLDLFFFAVFFCYSQPSFDHDISHVLLECLLLLECVLFTGSLAASDIGTLESTQEIIVYTGNYCLLRSSLTRMCSLHRSSGS